MATCITCGNNVSGKKFCPECGTPVQPTDSNVPAFCPHCRGEVKRGASFCMHCGGALNAVGQSPAHVTSPQVQQVIAAPASYVCPACQAQVSSSSVFCTSCGNDMRAPQGTGVSFCGSCGRQNAPGVRFCNGCGNPLNTSAQTGQAVSGSYPSYPATNPGYSGQQYQQPATYPQTGGYVSSSDLSPYSQSPYPQQYQQGQGQYPQNGYQPQPMMGQQPMVLRCPTCMAVSQVGTTHCPSCRTNLAGVVPMPANAGMPGQPQQQGGGFLQGNAGKLALGALGGAAALLGGQMLMNGLADQVENRVEDGLGHGHREENRFGGGLRDLADDIGLF
jgi:predicted amidophosphoribosyltransferase